VAHPSAASAREPLAQRFDFPGRQVGPAVQACHQGVERLQGADASGGFDRQFEVVVSVGALSGVLQAFPQPSDQGVRGKRLGQIVVGPGLVGVAAVGVAVEGRQDEDGDRPGLARVLELLADLEPAQAREHEVQKDGIGRLFGQQRQALLAAEGLDRFETVGRQNVGQQVVHIGLIFDDEDPRWCMARHIGRPPGLRRHAKGYVSGAPAARGFATHRRSVSHPFLTRPPPAP